MKMKNKRDNIEDINYLLPNVKGDISLNVPSVLLNDTLTINVSLHDGGIDVFPVAIMSSLTCVIIVTFCITLLLSLLSIITVIESGYSLSQIVLS